MTDDRAEQLTRRYRRLVVVFGAVALTSTGVVVGMALAGDRARTAAVATLATEAPPAPEVVSTSELMPTTSAAITTTTATTSTTQPVVAAVRATAPSVPCPSGALAVHAQMLDVSEVVEGVWRFTIFGAVENRSDASIYIGVPYATIDYSPPLVSLSESPSREMVLPSEPDVDPGQSRKLFASIDLDSASAPRMLSIDTAPQWSDQALQARCAPPEVVLT